MENEQISHGLHNKFMFQITTTTHNTSALTQNNWILRKISHVHITVELEVHIC